MSRMTSHRNDGYTPVPVTNLNLATPLKARRKKIKVFLSYVRLDSNHQVFRRLIADLRRLETIDLWYDKFELFPPHNLAQAVSEAVAAADYFVPVISKHTADSQWAQQEYLFAYTDQVRRQNIKIIPVRIDSVPSPRLLLSLVTIDLFKNYDAAFALLVQTIIQAPETLATFVIDRVVEGSTIITVSDRVNRELIEYFCNHPKEMKVMDRRLFEEFVAELFNGFGYEVELTKRTRDGGRDVVAVRHREVDVKYLIECKRPDPGHQVGVRPVRELLGVKTDEGATKGILATTAYFSKEATLFFERHLWYLEGRDFQGLMKWVKQYLAAFSKRSAI